MKRKTSLTSLPSFRGPCQGAGFRVSGASEKSVTYIAYLDEFGHIGPYIDRTHPQHNDSPVFGLVGIVLPLDEARAFATWFFQRKCDLLAFEMHNLNYLYRKILSEAIKRLNEFCTKDCNPPSNFIMALDEHDQRSALITQATRDMFGGPQPRKSLIEPPFQLESHRYQTLQAADWIVGLVGRLGAYWADPTGYRENERSHKACPRPCLSSPVCPVSAGIDWRRHEADSLLIPYNHAWSLQGVSLVYVTHQCQYRR